MIRKIIRWLLATCFLILFLLGILLWHVKTIALDEGYWKSEIHQYALVASLYDELANQVLNKQAELIPKESPLVFTNEEITALLNSLFPTGWVEDQINLVLDSFSTWLRSDEPELDFAIDISAQKATFGTEIKSRLQAKEESLPLCTPEEVKALQAAEQTLSLTCRPPGFSLEQFAGPEGYQFFDNISLLLPEQLTLRAILEGTIIQFPENMDQPLPPQPPPNVQNYQNFLTKLYPFRQALRLVELGFTLWFIVVLGLLSLLVTLSLRHPSALLGWFGYIMLWLGLALSVLSWFLRRGAAQLDAQILSSLGSDLSAGLQAAVVGIPKDVTNRFISPLEIWGIVALCLGLMAYAVLITLAIKRRRARRRAVPATALDGE